MQYLWGQRDEALQTQYSAEAGLRNLESFDGADSRISLDPEAQLQVGGHVNMCLGP